jgi:hypothetical protein
MKDIKQIPCKDCLVFPMCKQRAIVHSRQLVRETLFLVMKFQCSILRKAHNKTRDERNSIASYPKSVISLSDQKFVQTVLKHFDLWDLKNERLLKTISM